MTIEIAIYTDMRGHRHTVRAGSQAERLYRRWGWTQLRNDERESVPDEMPEQEPEFWDWLEGDDVLPE